MRHARSPAFLIHSDRTRIPSKRSSSGREAAPCLVRRLNNGLEGIDHTSLWSPVFDEGGKPDRALEERPHRQELERGRHGIRPWQPERDHRDDEVADAAILSET